MFLLGCHDRPQPTTHNSSYTRFWLLCRLAMTSCIIETPAGLWKRIEQESVHHYSHSERILGRAGSAANRAIDAELDTEQDNVQTWHQLERIIGLVLLKQFESRAWFPVGNASHCGSSLRTALAIHLLSPSLVTVDHDNMSQRSTAMRWHLA